jgi:hypothetical protein
VKNNQIRRGRRSKPKRGKEKKRNIKILDDDGVVGVVTYKLSSVI